MSAKYCLSPGKFLTFACDGYGNESERTVPFVMSLYFRRVSSVNDPGFPPSGIFALSCAIARDQLGGDAVGVGDQHRVGVLLLDLARCRARSRWRRSRPPRHTMMSTPIAVNNGARKPLNVAPVGASVRTRQILVLPSCLNPTAVPR